MSVKYSKAQSLLLIFSLAFNVAFGGMWIYNRAAALASPPPPPAPTPPWASFDLTPEQKEALEQKWQVAHRRAQDLQEELRQERNRMLEALAGPGSHEEAMQQYQQRTEEIQKQMRQLAMGQMRQMQSVLSTEQRRKWFQLMQARGAVPGGPGRMKLRQVHFEGVPRGGEGEQSEPPHRREEESSNRRESQP